jgi:aldehyde dehydrogenase (NAD+)
MKTHEIVEKQREFFLSGATIDVNYRIDALKRLRSAVSEHSNFLQTALYEDLHKSSHEANMTELGLVLEELRFHIKRLKKWNRPTKVAPSLGQIPASVKVYKEPYGVTLIMSPWNYPLLLTLSPLIGAISGGNTAIVKPSAYSPSTSSAIKKIIEGLFPSKYLYVVEGGRKENQELLKEHFDYIFFTGSTAVGKVVMEAASHHLTPITLELGGKSPVIVDKTADINLAAKRIIFGKLINCGQTCIAPDYVLVEESVKEALIEKMKFFIHEFLGEAPLNNVNYPKVINQKRFDRLVELLSSTQVIHGGKYDYPFIEPTLVSPKQGDLVMDEEIFGPILPIIAIESMEEAVSIIKSTPRPLALYLFSQDKKVIKSITSLVQYGGGCINDTIIHLANLKAPFGGVGYSGMGMYHGKYSFDTFTHSKTVMSKGKLFDISARYHPYTPKKSALIKKVLR